MIPQRYVLTCIGLLLFGCTWTFAAATQPAAPDEVADRAAGKLSVELFVPPEPFLDTRELCLVVRIVNAGGDAILIPRAGVAFAKVEHYRPNRKDQNWRLLLVIQSPPGPAGAHGPGWKSTTVLPHETSLASLRLALRSPAGVHQVRAALAYRGRIVAQSETATLERLPVR